MDLEEGNVAGQQFVPWTWEGFENAGRAATAAAGVVSPADLAAEALLSAGVAAVAGLASAAAATASTAVAAVVAVVVAVS